jgi:hypothetical protein
MGNLTHTSWPKGEAWVALYLHCVEIVLHAPRDHPSQHSANLTNAPRKDHRSPGSWLHGGGGDHMSLIALGIMCSSSQTSSEARGWEGGSWQIAA